MGSADGYTYWCKTLLISVFAKERMTWYNSVHYET
jgi:hypothetical protein